LPAPSKREPKKAFLFEEGGPLAVEGVKSESNTFAAFVQKNKTCIKIS